MDIAVVGGGPVGCHLAIILAKRGHHVSVFEQRDPAGEPGHDIMRSINLTICKRGLDALRAIGLGDEVRANSQILSGRVIHYPDNSTAAHSYGVANEHILAIHRGRMHEILLEKLAKVNGITYTNGIKCESVDVETGTFNTIDNKGNTTQCRAGVIAGADGLWSVVRSAIGSRLGATTIERNLDYGYKELLVSKKDAGGLEPAAFHVWPRGNLMIGASRNGSGDVSATLIMPYKGAVSFEAMQTEADWRDFFTNTFGDLAAMMPDLEDQLLNNPVFPLQSIKTNRWVYASKAFIIGDAAHPITPFYGQGLNAGLEDCMVLDDLLGKHDNDWSQALRAYEAARVPDAWAIADLAEDHFAELSDHVGDSRFLLKKQIDHHLHEVYGDLWKPMFSLISFTNLPYSQAVQIGQRQESVLQAILNIDKIDEIWPDIDYATFVDLDHIEILKEYMPGFNA